MVSCVAVTRRGLRCRARVVRGSDRCFAHRDGPVSEAGLVAQIAAADDWRAAAWLLERRHPERWARPAVRAEEKAPPAPLAGPDALDELAGRRDQRRVGR